MTESSHVSDDTRAKVSRIMKEELTRPEAVWLGSEVGARLVAELEPEEIAAIVADWVERDPSP
jgi:hypothetical protein